MRSNVRKSIVSLWRFIYSQVSVLYRFEVAGNRHPKREQFQNTNKIPTKQRSILSQIPGGRATGFSKNTWELRTTRQTKNRDYTPNRAQGKELYIERLKNCIFCPGENARARSDCEAAQKTADSPQGSMAAMDGRADSGRSQRGSPE